MIVLKRTLILSLICVSGCLAFNSSKGSDESTDTFLLNLILKCSKTEDFGNCLKIKAAHFLNKLIRMKQPLVITEYLSLAKDPKISEKYLQELNESVARPEENSIQTKEEKSRYLDRVIWDKLVSLFTTRTIQFSLPSEMFEGRGKGDKIFKKGQGILLMAGMMGGMMMKMALGKIALIAGKALIIGKIALIISLILALRRFANNGGGAPEVVLTSAELGGGRNFKGETNWFEDGGDLAYAAHKP